MRRPFQGVRNIVRFNWPFFAISLSTVLALLIFVFIEMDRPLVTVAKVLLIILIVPILVSLAVSLYVYDLSGFYNFDWLDDRAAKQGERIVNINAGFDETSETLKRKFPDCELIVFDFYDEKRHTEPSIARARRAYAAFAGTSSIATDSIPLPDHSADKVFAIMSAHEIRDRQERIIFFEELERITSRDGTVIVVEHFRDGANLLAYNVGALHFYTRAVWKDTFDKAKLKIEKEKKITPFVTAFFLERNGTQP